MKSLIKTILLLLAVLLPAAAAAHDFEVDGIYYNYLDVQGTVEVTISPDRYSGKVTIPATVTYNGSTYSVTAIGYYAFSDCRNLTGVTIPNSVITIGSHAFSSSYNLTNIVIPGSVTTIKESAFAGCNGLTSMTIPKSVTSIGEDLFYHCENLERLVVASGNPIFDSRDNCNAIIETASNTLAVGCKGTVIPNTVTAIGRHAFYGCESLTSITIPSSIITIGEGGVHLLRRLDERDHP